MVDLYIHCIFTECLLSEYILLYFNASHDQAVCLYNALQRLHVSAELHWQFCWRDCHRGMRSANSRVKQRLKMDCCLLDTGWQPARTGTNMCFIPKKWQSKISILNKGHWEQFIWMCKTRLTLELEKKMVKIFSFYSWVTWTVTVLYVGL